MRQIPLFSFAENLRSTGSSLQHADSIAQYNCTATRMPELNVRNGKEDIDFALPMLAVSTNEAFAMPPFKVEGKEVLPVAFSLQSTGSSLWFHWMWLNARLFNELESMLECIHYRARKLLSDTSLARAEVNK